MYTEFNGRQWSSEEQYLRYKNNVRLYMSRSLALENYTDCTGDTSINSDIAFQMLKEYRASKEKMTEEELIETTTIIIEKFNELVEKVGREKFTFYEDDSLTYNWPDNK